MTKWIGPPPRVCGARLASDQMLAHARKRSRGAYTMIQHRVRIDCRRVRDWESFHDLLAATLVLPAYYGRNMNALVDVLTSPDTEIKAFSADEHDPIVLELEHVGGLRSVQPEIWAAFMDAAAFVNFRRLEMGFPATVFLSYDSEP